jgi:hypothetical protein
MTQSHSTLYKNDTTKINTAINASFDVVVSFKELLTAGGESVALAAVVVVVVVVIRVQHVEASTSVQIVPAQSLFALLLSYM